MNDIKAKINFYSDVLLNSYSQIFFSKNKVLGAVLLFVSFFDYSAGLCGLLSIITGTILVMGMNMHRQSIRDGLYSFNNLLVGLGLGLTFNLSLLQLVLVVFASLLTSFFTFSLKGILGKYNLSYLSLPFLFAFWFTLLATSKFGALGLSIRGIYSHNEWYSIGGKSLVDAFLYLEQALPFPVIVYFKSLGAIFFQYNILSGILISIGLLFYSRIAFSLSVIGYLLAYLFYMIYGADITQLSYSYIGFNYILSAIAIGGYFYEPSRYSYLASILILPLVILITFGAEQILRPFSISVYSLPFNLVVLMFVYGLRYRTHRSKHLREVYIHQDTPEENLYLRTNEVTRMRAAGIHSIALPMTGVWTVSQGYNGKYTHKGEWQHGLDFIINDENGREYKGNGYLVEDYYCYGKNILAPADGYVVDIADGVPDNAIGNMDIIHNWGNSIVINHIPGLNTQISHLLQGSLLVKKGDYVKKGQVIAKAGNSGRSPYPHIHFQIQAATHVGAETLDYPLSNYITSFKSKSCYHAFGIPQEIQKVQNVIPTQLVANALKFNPGSRISYRLSFPNGKSKRYRNLKDEYTLEVHSDIYKNSYLECRECGSQAWFYNDGQIHFFNNFKGNKDSFLFYFMLAIYKVGLGFMEDVAITDNVPPHFTFKKGALLLQDFTAPFLLYFKSLYKFQYVDIDDSFSPTQIAIRSSVTNHSPLPTNDSYTFDVVIDTKGIKHITVNINGDIFEAECIKKQL